jgi:hypothetical protein
MEHFGLFYCHLVNVAAVWYILWPFGIFWYILWPFGIFYGHLVYFMAIWYILWPFGIFYGHFVYFMSISYIEWPFGILYGHLVYFKVIWYISRSSGIFPPFWFVAPIKIWQLCSAQFHKPQKAFACISTCVLQFPPKSFCDIQVFHTSNKTLT